MVSGKVATHHTDSNGFEMSEIVNVFPGATNQERLVLARETDDSGCKTLLVLRQESRSAHVGWFVQSRIPIEPSQIAGLKMTLTSDLVDREETLADHTVNRGADVLSFPGAVAG